MKTALACVLAAGLMPYLFTAVAKAAGPRYDNRDVRAWQARLSGWPYRANAAHSNAFEAFPLFAAAVLAAWMAGADAGLVGRLALAFVLLRAAYFGAYLADIHWLRSLLWFGGIGCSIAIFLKAIAGSA